MLAVKLLFAATVAIVALWGTAPIHAADFDHRHTAWNTLLQQHVRWINDGVASQVDYAGFKADQKPLDNYLESLSAVPAETFDSWSSAKRLAFLINAYNAYTLSLILTKYPDLDSIKDLGSLFSSPWKKMFFSLLGKPRSLDTVEHGMIRAPGVYDDPRIHMAVNCAAIGCPALRDEAYRGDRLDAQLDDAVARYLKDRTRNRYNAARRTIEAGKIFDWYAEDFEKGYRGISSLKQFFARHADHLTDVPAQRRLIRNQQSDISFTPYDWRLNARRQP